MIFKHPFNTYFNYDNDYNDSTLIYNGRVFTV